MGQYINPPDGSSKEVWLAEHGTPVSPAWPSSPGTLPVCLVDNGPFTAAAIAYSPSEFEAFQYPDGRSKRWYEVPVSDLAPFLGGR